MVPFPGLAGRDAMGWDGAIWVHADILELKCGMRGFRVLRHFVR